MTHSRSSSTMAGRFSADDWDNQMLYLPRQGLSRHRPRPPRSRPLDARPRPATTWTPMPPTSASSPTHLDLKRCHPCRTFHRRRRGRALCRPVRRSGRVAKAVLVQLGAPRHGEDGQESRRPADRGLRRFCAAAGCQPRPVLPRCAGRPLLRLQSPRREAHLRASSATGGGRA